MSTRTPRHAAVVRHVRLGCTEGDVVVRVDDVASIDTGHDPVDELGDGAPAFLLRLVDGRSVRGVSLDFVDVPDTETLPVSPYLLGFAHHVGIDAFVRDDDRFLPRLASTHRDHAASGALP